MIDLDSISKEDIIDRKEIYEEIFSIEDDVERGIAENKLTETARSCGAYKQAVKMLKVYREKRQNEIKNRLAEDRARGQVTDFTPDFEGKCYPVFNCGAFQATDYGIFTKESNGLEVCPHPIIPIERYRNIETGKEQVKIAFKRDGAWSELTVPKSIIAKTSAIVSLADYGVAVNSENAKYLVSYLTTVEARNSDLITLKKSTSKYGWRKVDGKKLFMPYDAGSDFVFDGERDFPNLCGAIKENGSYEKWLAMAKELRASSHIEARIAIAASFSSILIDRVGNLPFIVDFHGTTEGGKTVILMIAASVWANPSEAQFIGDFKTTETSIEARCDMLNNLPLMLDDSSKADKRIADNFENLIYSLCGGKGKSRSNRDIGAERERYWTNCIITNGERPLSDFASQAGAINRIIEVECSSKLLNNPGLIADIVRNNYGFAGKDFVEYIKTIDDKKIDELRSNFRAGLSDETTMDKQVLSMTTILIADYLATECIFQDGKRLTVDDVKRFLSNKNDVSEGARCYQYIVDVITSQGQHFDMQFNNFDQWGTQENLKDGGILVDFYPSSLDEILSKRNFNRKAFIMWLNKQNLITKQNGKCSKNGTIVKRLSSDRTTRRVVEIIIKPDYFNSEEEQLPF